MDLAKQLMKSNHRATINIVIGQDFNFKFSNENEASSKEKNKSPSQIKKRV